MILVRVFNWQYSVEIVFQVCASILSLNCIHRRLTSTSRRLFHAADFHLYFYLPFNRILILLCSGHRNK